MEDYNELCAPELEEWNNLSWVPDSPRIPKLMHGQIKHLVNIMSRNVADMLLIKVRGIKQYKSHYMWA